MSIVQAFNQSSLPIPAVAVPGRRLGPSEAICAQCGGRLTRPHSMWWHALTGNLACPRAEQVMVPGYVAPAIPAGGNQ